MSMDIFRFFWYDDSRKRICRKGDTAESAKGSLCVMIVKSKRTGKAGFREMAALEKARMLPLNFAFSYIMIPGYVVLSVILLMIFGAQMEAGAVVPGLICIGMIALLLIGLLCMIPYVRKKAVQAELKRYDLKRCLKDAAEMPSRDVWDFSDGELNVRCKQYGMEVNGRLYYYNHLRKAVITSNEFRRVSILLCFVNADDQVIALPLNAKTLKMLLDFDVMLDNHRVLEDILAHPEKAFEEIYKTGEVNLSRISA